MVLSMKYKIVIFAVNDRDFHVYLCIYNTKIADVSISGRLPTDMATFK